MKRILIIDDDMYIGNMLEETLTAEGYLISHAWSGTEALLVLERQKPDLILLDLMLPGLSGEELLPKLHGIPVIIISAKIDLDNKVNLLLGGAADYMTKPFDVKELLARIAVQFRNAAQISESADSHFLHAGDVTLNTDTHTALISNQTIRLTRTEYAILKILMNNPSQVITKSRLLDCINEDTPDCTESSLKVHVSNLRRKLREASEHDYIEAVWGIGFKFRSKESV